MGHLSYISDYRFGSGDRGGEFIYISFELILKIYVDCEPFGLSPWDTSQ